MQSPRQDSRIACSVFGIIWSVAFTLSGGHSYSIDEETYLANLRALLHGSRNIVPLQGSGPSYLVMPDKTGVPTSFYGIGTALFNVPSYLLGKTLSFLVAPEWREQLFRIFFFATNSFALAVSGSILFLIAREFGATRKMSVCLALAYATGTYALSHSKTGFAETLTAMFLVLSIYCFVRLRRDAYLNARFLFVFGLSIGCAISMRASALVFAPLLFSGLLLRGRAVRAVIWSVGGLALPMAVVLWNNWWRFGSIFDTGYPNLSYTTPLYEGIFGLLMSPGKGLFLFAPITIIAVFGCHRAWKIDRVLTAVIAGMVFLNLGLFARFEIWSGDNAYGPRYMGIILPTMLVLVAMVLPQISFRTLMATWLAGAALTIGGTLTYVNAVYYKMLPSIESYIGKSARNEDNSFNWDQIRRQVNFTPRFSQLKMHSDLVDDGIRRFLANIHPKSAVNIFENGVSGQLSWYSAEVRLDTWWAIWLETGGPIWVVVFLLCPILISYYSVRTIRRALKLEV